ncbi:putative zinc finger protein [Plasmodium gaboni]|uniref:Putative zinc finger protein n=1 Tax=Plasmodium gaboni TaxID=647221 RepID=A0A151LVR6_9APIC|nr:putative zinc finger protein [Plasmodium gaboni]KYO03263.1 putative zinc finger protein [Plasmodium gaboni]
MDIRSEIVNSIIYSLKRCKNKNKYILLLNELLSLFPAHAEKSLKLCLKSSIKKYTLIEENDSPEPCKYYGHKILSSKKKESFFSDTTIICNKKKKEGKRKLSSIKSNRYKKTCIHFFVLCGNKRKYVVFQNFCSCFYFKEKVLCNNNDVLCKHLLSVFLAKCFHNYRNIFLNSDLFFEWYLKKLNISNQ